MNRLERLLLLILVCHHTHAGEEYIHCPLVWVRGAFGETIPDDSIPAAAYGLNNYVGRTYFESSSIDYVVGTLRDGVLHSVYKGAVNANMTYDVLTNPHGCLLDWIQNPADPQAVPSWDGTDESYVGRGVFRDVLLSGHISRSGGGDFGIQVADDGQALSSPTFRVLQSYSKGLTLVVTGFVLDQNPVEGNVAFLGFDEISNEAEVTVRQSIEHNKTIFESTEVRTHTSWGMAYKISFELELNVEVEGPGFNESLPVPIPPIAFGNEIPWTEDKATVFYSESKRNVSARREIVVHPFTSVQACSTLSVNEGFSAEFRAEGKYSAPGLSAAQVEDILRLDGIVGSRTQDGVLVEIKGAFGGTLLTSTKFMVSESRGCSQLNAKITELRDARRRKIWSEDQVSRAEAEISAWIQQM